MKGDRKKITLVLAGFTMLSALFLVGCSLETPTNYSQNKIRVIETDKHLDVKTADLTDAALSQIGGHYRSYGDGPVDVLVTYCSTSQHNTAMKASSNLNRIVAGLRKNGVTDVNAEIMPVNRQYESRTYIDYVGYDARPPEDCPTMEDLDKGLHSDMEPYKLGCSTDTYMTRQIAHPKDLAGREGIDEGDGRRQHNIIEGYRTGSRNGALSGESASGD